MSFEITRWVNDGGQVESQEWSIVDGTNTTVTLNAGAKTIQIDASGGGGDGTVTSVALSVPTGLSVSGSPITTSGTLAISLTSGYAIPTTTQLTKLDGIESGATADQSAAEILAALVTVDGASSGLDADLLDGNHAAAFALAGHDHSATYQPLDADLTAIAGLSSADGNFIVGSAGGWVAESGATARTSLGLGTAAIANTGDFEAAGAVSTHSALTSSVHGISTFGASLVDDATAGDARTTLGLGSLATQSGTFSGTSSGTNTGDQTITLTGDVTGSGTGSFAATIAAGAVDIAMLSATGTPSSTSYLLGNNTWQPVDSNVVTWQSTPSGSNFATALGGTAVPYAAGGTGLTTLGTALQILRVNAGATALEFATLSGGGDALVANPLSQFAATTSAQLRGVLSDELGAGAALFDGAVLATGMTFPVAGLQIFDTASDHKLTISPGNDFTANRVLTLRLGDADRLLQLGGTLQTTGNLTTTGGFAIDLTATAGTSVTLPTSGTLLTTTGSAANLTSFPTLNQNTTGTAAGLSVTLAVGSGGTGLTALGSGLQVLRTNAGATAMEWATLAGGGDLLAANNLSDLANASTARTNLGLAIGTNVQAYDADLTTWAGITPGTGVGTFLATPSSANLAAAVTDETGSGALVFATSPTLVTPLLGTPTSGTLTNCTGLPTAGLVDDAVTLAKMASGTAGNLITYDASGNPAAVSTGTSGHVLTSNGAGAAPTFQAAAGGTTRTYKRLAANFATTSTSFVDVDNGSGDDWIFAVAANTDYELNVVGRKTSSGSTIGVELGVNGPASPDSVLGYIEGTITGVTTNQTAYFEAYDADINFASGPSSVAFSGFKMRILIRNGANSGNVAIRLRAEAAGTVTILEGAICDIQEITIS